VPLQALGCVIEKFLGCIAALFGDTFTRSNPILNCISNG
jgi:hypothetical protein